VVFLEVLGEPAELVADDRLPQLYAVALSGDEVRRDVFYFGLAHG
jgi:hypothetical protein